MSTDRTSLDRAFHEEAGENRAMFGADISAEQLDMLRDGDGKLPGNVFQMARQQAAQRSAGRPKGSRNRRSDDLARLIVHQHGDPVMAMASMYSRPLDQMVEALLIADGTQERQRQLDANIAELSMAVKLAAGAIKGAGADMEAINRLADACEALESVSRRSQGKPGDLAIKALNVQLAAAKATAEYVHSKKPVEAVVKHQADAVIMFPSLSGIRGTNFDQLDSGTREAGEIIQRSLKSGAITPDMLVDMQFIDGQLVDGNCRPVEDDDDSEVEA
jgi:hypothetical protein